MSSKSHCLIHLESGEAGKLINFNRKSWDRVREFATKWSSLDGNESIIGRDAVFQQEEIPQGCGYHSRCYARFTDSTKVSRAEKRSAKRPAQFDESMSVPSEGKRQLRTKKLRPAEGQRSKFVLPDVCIICKKKLKWIKSGNSRVRDKLALAETIDGGLLRQAATIQDDESILREIRDQDCVALEVKYHHSCYRHYTRFLQKDNVSSPLERDPHHVAFNQFCENVIEGELIAQQRIIRLRDLLARFNKIVEETQGLDVFEYRTDRLKQRLKKRYPLLSFIPPSRKNESEFVCWPDTPETRLLERQSTSTSEPSSDEPLIEAAEGRAPQQFATDQFKIDNLRELYHASMLLRDEIRQHKATLGPWPPLASDLTIENVESFVPTTLFNSLAWIVGASDEPTIEHRVSVSEAYHRRILSLLQDVIYLESDGRNQTPKSLCLGLTLKHLTGSSQVLNLVSKLGHCASYSTILNYDTALAQLQLNRGEVFVPVGFKKNIFSILVWDNIDFSEETLTGMGTTHHTNGILIQKDDPTDVEVQEIAEATPGQFERVVSKKVRKIEKPATLLVHYQSKKRSGPQPFQATLDIKEDLQNPCVKNAQNTDHAFFFIKYCDNSVHRIPGWTGFNVQLHMTDALIPSKVAYMPVLDASPTEMDTVNTILSRSVEMADNLQLETILVVFDQSIYAKAQTIRWSDENFTKRLVIRLGEFHTIMSYLSILGKRYGSAGLADILLESQVVAAGSLHQLLEGRHYNRAIRAHKLVVEALQRLRLHSFFESVREERHRELTELAHTMTDAYPSTLFKRQCHSEEFLTFVTEYEDYIRARSGENPTFAFWSSYIENVETLLHFLRATRESNWEAHLVSLRSMMPLYFAYGKTNYARYLPAYLLEMKSLATTHPQVYQAAIQGDWTVQQQSRYGFSATACDQVIEQTCNRDSKTTGGITGLTLNRNAVHRWILSQSERAAVARQCEAMAGQSQQDRDKKDLDAALIGREEEAIVAILNCVDSMIDPFATSSEDLICITSGAVATSEVHRDLMTARAKGEKALMEFIEDRLMSNKVDFHKPIKQLKLKTFADNTVTPMTSKAGKTATLTADRQLFSRMVIISQQRKIDLKNALTFSLGPVSFPLAAADGTLAKTDKSALLRHLESKQQDIIIDETRTKYDAILVDGMAVVHSLSSALPATFGGLADSILGYVLSLAAQFDCPRVDIVFDRYLDISIKCFERQRRGQASRHRMKIFGDSQKTPQQWKDFLSDGVNKEHLMDFLLDNWSRNSHRLANCTIFVGHGDKCHKLTSEGMDLVSGLSSDHEVAGTRLLLHARHVSQEVPNGTIQVRSPDTDVGILLIGHSNELSAKLHFRTGVKKTTRTINIETLSQSLGADTCKAVVGLHVFSGCDTTSSFRGKGKRRPFDLMVSSTAYKNIFMQLGSSFEPPNHLRDAVEHFVCELYGQKCLSVDEARYRLFCLGSNEDHTMPPTSDALWQHCLRSNYQAAVHRRALMAYINAPSPQDHGWSVEGSDVKISWMKKDPIPDELLNIVHCKCAKTKCSTNRCSCRTNEVPCTDLCECLDCTYSEKSVSMAFGSSDYDSDSDM